MTYGPWSPLCFREERGKQLRCLQGIIACQHGSDHPLIAALRAAETDAMRFVEALDAMEKFPALYRRRALSTFARVTWPPYNAERDFAGSIDEAYRAVRERVANGGPPWTPRTGGEP